ncbi:hypothetical protein QAD02_016814 [Eretmocerus hayati]|uniref:Uncharacterized protein n=1 Tax=Eretmocerus hayati TaxID=131215 RepID=A0ACC2PF04_9HYME|nr:hypothetical protein QAD02_016814 [Eretmocerus hayati]
MSLRMEMQSGSGTLPYRSSTIGMGAGTRVRQLRRRNELGRRLTRRLSLVAKVPAQLLLRANPPEPRRLDITAIAPDKTQLTPNHYPLLVDIGFRGYEAISKPRERERPNSDVLITASHQVQDSQYLQSEECTCDGLHVALALRPSPP